MRIRWCAIVFLVGTSHHSHHLLLLPRKLIKLYCTIRLLMILWFLTNFLEVFSNHMEKHRRLEKK